MSARLGPDRFAQGKLVASELERELKAPLQADKTQNYTAFGVSDRAGPHTLKLAVVDDSGRRGSVEHDVHARAERPRPAPRGRSSARRSTSTCAASNAAACGGGGFHVGDVVNTYVELFSEVAEQLKAATDRHGSRRRTRTGARIDGAMPARSSVQLREPIGGWRRQASDYAPAARKYVARAVISCRRPASGPRDASAAHRQAHRDHARLARGGAESHRTAAPCHSRRAPNASTKSPCSRRRSWGSSWIE